MKSYIAILYVASALLISSCSSDTQVNVLGFNSISGTAQTFNGSSSLNTVVMSCANVTVYLYKLDENGDKIEPAAASTGVDSSGRYEFKNVRNLIKFDKNIRFFGQIHFT